MKITFVVVQAQLFYDLSQFPNLEKPPTCVDRFSIDLPFEMSASLLRVLIMGKMNELLVQPKNMPSELEPHP
jgi:hypothetical protein